MSSGLITPLRDREATTFVWDGVDWTFQTVRHRAVWSGLAFAVVLAAAIPFDRFDPARSRLRPDRRSPFAGLRERVGASRRKVLAGGVSAETVGIQIATAAHLMPVAATRGGRWFLGVLAAELKLMLRGLSWVWYIGAIGLIVACLASPIDAVRRYLLPAVWLWPLLIWSQMGIRERRHGTEQIVFSTPHPVLRQMAPMWLSSVIVTVTVGSGAWIRIALAGEGASLLAWFAGALFVPSLALALGVWVGNSRAFELVYLLLWYVGVFNRVPAFDYAGATAEGLAMGMPAVYLAISAGLVALAVIGRWRRLRR